MPATGGTGLNLFGAEAGSQALPPGAGPRAPIWLSYHLHLILPMQLLLLLFARPLNLVKYFKAFYKAAKTGLHGLVMRREH